MITLRVFEMTQQRRLRFRIPCALLVLTLGQAFRLAAADPPFGILGWGSNAYGESDVPALTNAVAVSAGSGHNVALLADGRLAGWGGNGPTLPAGLGNLKAVSTRFSFGLALSSNGTVTAWGANVPLGLANVVAISAGNYHALALRDDGTVVGWGGQDGAGVVPPGLAGVAAISAGLSHSLALRSNGTVAAWGWNGNGQASAPSGLDRVVAISAGGYHSMALKNDGTVIVWGGQNASVQPPPGLSEVAAISAGEWHNLALRSNGTVVAWGDNSTGQASVPVGLRDVVAIAAGQRHSVALLAAAAPLILVEPQNITRYVGGEATFSVNAAGAGSLSYQWRKDGVALSGALSPGLTIGNADFEHAGMYTVVVSTFSGSVTSAPASLSVLAPPLPTIQAQPESTATFAGSNATFTVAASGGTLFYQWLRNDVPIGAATESTLTLTNASFADAGTFTVIVSNYSGSITSAPAVLTVLAPPDYNVTTAGAGYGGTQFVVNGQAGNPSLTLVRGQTYRFAVATGSTHPLQIVTAAGTPYNTGVSNNNTSSGTLTFTVPESAPDTLRYICSVHFFGGTINIVSPPNFRILSVSVSASNVVLKSIATNGWQTIPEFSSNLVQSDWRVVPAFTNTLLNGTNTIVFDRLEPICGSNVFLRLRNTQN